MIPLQEAQQPQTHPLQIRAQRYGEIKESSTINSDTFVGLRTLSDIELTPPLNYCRAQRLRDSHHLKFGHSGVTDIELSPTINSGTVVLRKLNCYPP